MQYNPKDAITVWPAGEYEGVLTSCEETVSKKGNPMLKIVWTIFNQAGRSRKVDDYIVNPGTLYKLKKVAKALGKLREFEEASFQLQDYLDCHLILDVGIEQHPGFDEKNVVGSYKTPSPDMPMRLPAAKTDEEDIPF